ncbi:hypothetical protein QPL79_01500 [Ignisphaera sp. 4213-co]|uniref:Uncharacterized protein n=1 Tax=Ignisphaera cupida TaxID=3050454 RepID=A0ABD4Z4G3_9CREN|nr:hypothetical protein [Ignisphaera sp. 4213-co]MDK6028040.1 hypothetical protein [Ignisphaera sp. 4213-co]
MKIDVELVEVYRYEGIPGTRFRFRVKGTKIYFNVTANDLEEATKKVEQMIKNLELDKYLEKMMKNANKEN